jgi:hypothetical protein
MRCAFYGIRWKALPGQCRQLDPKEENVRDSSVKVVIKVHASFEDPSCRARDLGEMERAVTKLIAFRKTHNVKVVEAIVGYLN